MTSRRSLAAGILAACIAAAFLPTPTTSFAEGGGTPPLPPVGMHDRIGGFTQRTSTIMVTFDADQKDPAAAAGKVVEQAVGSEAVVTQVVPITKDTAAVSIDTVMTPAEAADLGQQVEQTPGVDTAEPSGTFTQTSTNDPYYSLLWNVTNTTRSTFGTHAEDAWPATTGAGVVIGVIDTGILPHTDLTGSTTAVVGGNVLPGYDFIATSARAGDGNGRDSDPTDRGDGCTTGEAASWHGTHVTGIAAAIRNNKVGVVGVAPGAKVQPLRALGKCGGTETDIISAIRWGAGLPIVGIPHLNPTPADVLNLSLGGPGVCSTAMQSAIDAAVGKGTTVVIAAGNDSIPVAGFSPASCRNVIRVAASSYEGTLAPYSNYGTSAGPITISAPGGSGNSGYVMNDWILSTWNRGTIAAGAEWYSGWDGTSMAAPHVAATVALLRALDKSLTPARITSILTSTATRLASPCDTTRCGAGAVNAAAAVRSEAGRLLASTGAATITGTAAKGSTLTAHVSGRPALARISYQWLRSQATITGATSGTYVLTESDAGKLLTVRATISIGATSVTRVSAAVTTAPGSFTPTKAPSTSGTFTVGSTVKVTGGTQSPTPSAHGYRWLRNGTLISGATRSSYKLTSSDRGKQVSAQVTVARSGYRTASYLSARHIVSTFVASKSPSATGTFRVGKTVKVSSGTQSPTPTTRKYRWLRNGASISGATRSSYKLTKSDKGKQISVRVTVSRSGYTTASYTTGLHRVS